MPAPLASSLEKLGQEVPLGRVDRELKKIWASDDGKTKASLMNFAIYSEDAGDLDRNLQLLDQITAEHSCRALLILCQPGRTPKARAWINALCRPYQGKLAVCSEQLSFVIEGGDAAVVQNIVFAHLESDLPLAVWWQGDLTSNFEERFYSEIDRLFIDSSQWSEPAAEFTMLEAAFHGDTSDFEIHDLSWTRSHFLRAAFASCFQDAVALRKLPLADKIEITHARGHRIGALLLAAWIARRLGCEIDERSKAICFVKPEGGALSLRLTETAEGAPLRRVAISGPDLCAEARKAADSPFIQVRGTCDKHEHDEMLPADPEDESELISSQLSRAHGTSLFISMVPMLRQMLAK